jgi:hypothetical protein
MSKQAGTLFQSGLLTAKHPKFQAETSQVFAKRTCEVHPKSWMRLLAAPLFSRYEIGTMKNTLSGTSSAAATQLIPEKACASVHLAPKR